MSELREMTKAITVKPEAAMRDAKQSKNIVAQMLKDAILVEGIDYGKIPGTDKNTLLKAGAERLCKAFHLAPRFETVTQIERWDGDNPLFFYRIRTTLIHIESGLEVATGVGSCNSWETKYRWRWVPESNVAPHLDKSKLVQKAAIISEFTFAINKAETTGKYGKPAEYWQKFKDAMADGSARKVMKPTKSGNSEAYEIGGTLYRVPNDECFDLVNTVDKMAQKRSLIASVLIGANASEFFAQGAEYIEGFGVDYDEDVIEAEFTVISPAPVVTEPTTPPASKIVTLPQQESTEDPTPPISGADARAALGNGDKRRVTQDAPNSKPAERASYPAVGPSGEMIDWANEDNIKLLTVGLNARIPGIQIREIVQLAGVKSIDDYVGWNEKFTSGRIAVAGIMSAWEGGQKPAAPRAIAWTADEKQVFIDWVEKHFGKLLSEVEDAMETVFFDAYKSPMDAMTAVIERATAEHWDVITDEAHYNGSYIAFKTVLPNDVRVYGRSTDFKKAVGSGYYAANKISEWVSDYKKPQPIAPLRLSWEKKSSDQGTYYLSDKGKQFPVTPMPDAAPEVAPVAEELDLADVPF